MKYSISIDYPFETMEGNKKRMAAWPTYKYADRVPVHFCLEPRYFAPLFDLEYNEIFKDAETQFGLLLKFAKYQIENIPSDGFCQEPVVWVHPYFDNVAAASACGGNVQWPYDQTPQAYPPSITTMDQMDAFEAPALDAGLFGKKIEWWHIFNDLAKDSEVTFNGQPGRVGVSPLSINHLGPFMVAIDLVGMDFYWWILEAPERCHRFLAKLAAYLSDAELNIRKIDPRPRPSYMIAEDSSTVMSPESFREFTIPYTKVMYERCGSGAGIALGRGMHMCGPSTHLHEILVDDLKITSFDIFGFQVTPETIARNMGGKVLLWGNVSPMLMLNGTKEEVKEAAMEALEGIAPCGGLLLGDGANVCPGTPLENLAVFTEASAEYAQGHGELFTGA